MDKHIMCSCIRLYILTALAVMVIAASTLLHLLRFFTLIGKQVQKKHYSRPVICTRLLYGLQITIRHNLNILLG